jgi:hypothetical protein|tara:strand:- start:22894 stop:23415 length:522 start_codon:yes stop_codon:yes gene_type:complete
MATNTFDCGTNYLQPSGFKIIISRRDFPNLQFYAQTISHPDVNLPSAELGFSRVNSVPFVGDAAEFGTLTMEVLLDEDMNSYREIYNWMIAATSNPHRLPSASVESNKEGGYQGSTYNDITVAILSSHNNVNRTFRYINGFPTSVGMINLAATSQEQYLSFQATFRFDYFEFK